MKVKLIGRWTSRYTWGEGGREGVAGEGPRGAGRGVVRVDGRWAYMHSCYMSKNSRHFIVHRSSLWLDS